MAAWPGLRGRLGEARALLGAGADPNAAACDGTTPLMLAVQVGEGWAWGSCRTGLRVRVGAGVHMNKGEGQENGVIVVGSLWPLNR